MSSVVVRLQLHSQLSVMQSLTCYLLCLSVIHSVIFGHIVTLSCYTPLHLNILNVGVLHDVVVCFTHLVLVVELVYVATDLLNTGLVTGSLNLSHHSHWYQSRQHHLRGYNTAPQHYINAAGRCEWGVGNNMTLTLADFLIIPGRIHHLEKCEEDSNSKEDLTR